MRTRRRARAARARTPRSRAATRRSAPRARSRSLGAAARPLFEPGDELVEPQLLEPAPDRVELARAELDEPAALLAEVQRLAQPGLAGVQSLDDLLEPRRGGLVGLRGVHAPSSGFLESVIRAPTRPSPKNSRTSRASRACCAD